VSVKGAAAAAAHRDGRRICGRRVGRALPLGRHERVQQPPAQHAGAGAGAVGQRTARRRRGPGAGRRGRAAPGRPRARPPGAGGRGGRGRARRGRRAQGGVGGRRGGQQRLLGGRARPGAACQRRARRQAGRNLCRGAGARRRGRDCRPLRCSLRAWLSVTARWPQDAFGGYTPKRARPLKDVC